MILLGLWALSLAGQSSPPSDLVELSPVAPGQYRGGFEEKCEIRALSAQERASLATGKSAKPYAYLARISFYHDGPLDNVRISEGLRTLHVETILDKDGSLAMLTGQLGRARMRRGMPVIVRSTVPIHRISCSSTIDE